VIELMTVENLTALLTLTALEIVLGIDNIIIIAVLAERLPEEQQARGRAVGLLLAMVMRIALLWMIKWVLGLEATLFTVASLEVTGSDLIMFFGGLFLIGKATLEIHAQLDEVTHSAGDNSDTKPKRGLSFAVVLSQIVFLDVVFSIDSVITAVGMAEAISVMILAIVIAVIVMIVFAGAISRFIKRNPTLKMLALAFLFMVGMVLIADGLGLEISKGYIYFAMAFSLSVELLNLKVIKGLRRTRKSSGG